MVTRETLEARRAVIAASPDLTALLAHLTERAAPLLTRMPSLPRHKALLSMDGGVCAADGAALTFDPWSPAEHRCPRCGAISRGERHDQNWARFQHLWLAERAAHLAALGALAGDHAAAARGAEILAAYGERYRMYPNRDNVLGPSRLFSSTYAESIWLLDYLAAAVLLRESDALDEPTAQAVAQVADEAANLIGEYDEGLSNRQTWNHAALLAAAAWFEDEELARSVLEGRTGLLAHLRGFREDGLWYEGENYHLFALRGLLTGAAWARLGGMDFFADSSLRERILRALLAPSVSALPDLTFPARKDARFGVSLAQPMYLETWEVALGMLGSGEPGAVGDGGLTGWLRALYAVRAPVPELFESYLHDAPMGQLPASRGSPRAALSWWALLEMPPALPDAAPWTPASALLPSQGLAVLRSGERYVSLECGPLGGGHGHADRLHLTLHAGGVHWLPDFGTGSYVSPDLFWYRSGLAHNAPLLDGGVGARAEATCERFDIAGEWGWVRGRTGDVTRTAVTGPAYVLDVVEVYGRDERVLELPWHFRGATAVVPEGRWEPGQLRGEFVTDVQRFVPGDVNAPLTLETAADGLRLTAHLPSGVELLRATAPGLPGTGERAPFYVLRARGLNLRVVTALEPHAGTPVVLGVRVRGDDIEVETGGGVDRHRVGDAGWTVERAGTLVRLAGRIEPGPPSKPFLYLEPPTRAVGTAFRIAAPPPLDGTPGGFDTGEPLRLELEDQYRRSEEPYPGPDDLAAVAYAAWDDDALYLGVEVTKAELCFRAGDALPARLDNEPDDVHSDGLQVYLRATEEPAAGFLIVPDEDGRLRVRRAGLTDGNPEAVRGAWQATDTGYRVTLAVTWPEAYRPHVGARVGFDLIVNEMRPGRVRRAGQLVWSGGNGWVWLWGDRQDPARFGVMELVG